MLIHFHQTLRQCLRRDQQILLRLILREHQRTACQRNAVLLVFCGCDDRFQHSRPEFLLRLRKLRLPDIERRCIDRTPEQQQIRRFKKIRIVQLLHCAIADCIRRCCRQNRKNRLRTRHLPPCRLHPFRRKTVQSARQFVICIGFHL